MKYQIPQLAWERREMEYRELERHKDMEREREIAERHHRQIQQQQQERDQQHGFSKHFEESNTQQAVDKHFEESLRRAKEKHQQFMRPTWTLNAIPPPHQTSAPPSHLSHLNQQSHVPSSQNSNQNSGGNNPGLLQDDRRRTISVDHDRAYLDREIEKDRFRHEQQQRAFFAANSMGGIQQRTQSKNEYSQSSSSQSASLSQHRGISIQPSNKSNDKLMSESGGNSSAQQQQQQQRILMDSSPGNYKMYGYGSYPSQLQSSTSSSSPVSSNFHKELNKSKPELLNSSLSNPPPLLSDIKQSAGVIVKHDTSINKIPIQLVQTPKHPTTHYPGKSTSIPNHQIYEYRTQQQSPHDRYKSPSVTVLSTSQSYQIRAQTPPTSNQQQHQSQQSPLSQQSQNVHFGGATITPTIATKPKLQTPATHFYGKPSGAGIVSGIPVCRSQDSSVFATKSPSPSSPFHNQQQLYGSGPPPAHSRHEYRMHQQPNAVVGGTGVPSIGSSVVGVGKSSLSHSIANHPHHSHNAHHLSHHTVSSPPTSITNISSSHAISSRSPGLITSNLVGAQSQLVNNQSFQTQPLDLGVSNRDESNTSSIAPKRKGTPIHHPVGSPIPLDIKKKKIEISQQNSPLELRVNTPSPHVTASPTIIPAVLGTPDYNIHQVVTKSSNMEMNHTIDITTTPSKSPISILNSSDGNSNLSIGGGGTGSGDDNNDDVVTNNNNTTDGTTFINTKLGVTDCSNFLTNTIVVKSGPSINNSNALPSTNSSPSQSPGVVLTSGSSSGTGNQPQTPAKLDVITSNSSNTNTILNQVTSSTDSSKSTSPVTKSSSSSAPRHLKKAWLQRHKTGEDFDDLSITGGGGNCVKLPLTIATQSNCSSTPPVHSLHAVGSMAINSINKTKPNLVGVNSSNAKVSSSQHPKKILVNQSNYTSGGVNNNSNKPDNSNNGHNTDSDLDDNSSSSDQERTTKNPLKRKSSKVKKRKGGITRKPQDDLKKKKVTNTVSESDKDSDSEHDSMSDKDSDSGTSTSQGNKKTSNGSRRESSLADSKEPRKRGRRPKTSTSKDDTGSGKKKQKEESPLKDPFRKPPISQLKKTGDSFLQDGPCFEVAPKLAKCRECRWTPNQRSKNTPNIFCRFYAFRRLRYTKNSQLAIAGFSDPHKDPTEEDLKLWMPDHDNPPTDLDLQMSRFLLLQVGDQFCDLLQQEREAMLEHMSDDKTIAWKRVVQGVREMCDVCETTLFNYHWACGKCGFVVCLDCYKDRKSGSAKIWGEPGKDRDECSWLLCTNRSSHEQEKLMLTQIIAGDSLQVLGRRTHETRALWDIPQYCGCGLSMEQPSKATNGICKEYIKNLLKNDSLNGLTVKDGNDRLQNGKSNETSESALSWLADVALQQNSKKNNGTSNSEIDEDDEDDDDFDTDDNDEINKQRSSTLRELLIRPSSGGSSNIKPNGSRANSPNKTSNSNLKKSKMDSLDEVISSVIENSKKEDKSKIILDDNLKNDTDDKSGVLPLATNQMTDDHKMELKHFICKQRKFKHQLPIRIMTMVKSSSMYPNVPHTWLCDGKLLRLLDPINPGNYRIFQDQWKRGQPVLVSEVTKNLNIDLWHPDSFAKDFGDGKNDLINCMNGNLLPNQSMKRFWEGFENITKRLKDDKGNPMLLKLKDWPPGEDFAEILPTRFNDLMKCLPLGDYTQRNGRLNLASRLPDCFVRPDLGPKMYNAYGSALYANKGTTNLHLDISDAVNVMVYIGIPKDGPDENYLKTEAYKAIDEAGCDILMRRRVRDKGETPGAIWHIYAAKDADKIRDLLNKVAIERGERLEPNHDPIHDQSWYLDGPLRERLYREYGVEGYPIAQCLGDAVFIPAGAPHQVRNLHNCIKVAEDFVSPENVYHCFHLTHEFRELSDTHSNHEDKLQIKNIIYHAVKDALACLSHLLGQRITDSQAMDVSSTTSTSNQTKIKTEIKSDDENDNNDV